MEANAYRRGMGNIFKRLILSGVQEQKNSQQNKGNKNPSREEIRDCTT